MHDLHADAEKRLLDFDRAWQAGEPPRLADFLPTDADQRQQLLQELIKIDLEYRWRRGTSALLEEYAQNHPELGPADQLPLDLIAAEYEARLSWGDQPRTEEYLARFATHGAALSQRLSKVHAWVVDEGGSKPTRVLSAPAPAANGVEVRHDATTAGLVEQLRGLQLLSVEQLAELERTWGAAGPEPPALMRQLVGRGWLTPFQADQLLLGLGAELRLGPYRLLDYLGEGATGRVYKARDDRDDRLVALKVIRKELLAAAEVVARFHREVQLASQLDHPNLVRALDASIGPTLILAMDYVEGTDLARLVKQSGPLSVERACDCVRQAALALQYAHERGMVHRDVKPSNLMMTARGSVKLLDLGLARFRRNVDDETSHTLMDPGTAGTMTPIGAVMMGTPDYMAPEQALDFHQADVRADIYSLGCTLYFLLTGKPPFAGSTLTAKLLHHQQAEPPPLTRFRSDVPESVVALLGRMMAKEPERRPQTPAEVVAALEGADADRTLPQAVPSALRPRPWRRRIALAVIALLVGFGVWNVAMLFRIANSPFPVPLVSSNFADLVARADDPNADVALLRHDIVSFRAAHPGTRESYAAACLLMRVRAPLDDIDEPLVPVCERFPDAPPELLAVLGERCFRHRGTVEALAFAPDGQTLFSGGGSDGTIHVWNVEERTEQTTLKTNLAQVLALAFSPDGETIATGGDALVRLWDAAGRRERMQLRGHTNNIVRLVYSSDGAWLASASSDKSIKVWDKAGRERCTFANLPQVPSALAFSPDGKFLLSGSNDKLVRIWEMAGGRERPALEKHTAGVAALVFSPDGALLASGGGDGKIILWDAANWRVRRELKNGVAVHAVAFTPDGKALVAGGRDGTIKLWDVAIGRETATLRGHFGTVNSLVFPRDGRLLASGGADGTLRLWDLRKERELTPSRGHAGAVNAVSFSPDGSALATAGADHTVRLWAAATGQETAVLAGHTGAVLALAHDATGRTLASASADGTVRFWATAPVRQTGTLPQKFGAAQTLAFAPDGALIAVGYQSGALRFANPTSATERRTIQAHKQPVHGIAFAPDGGVLAAASEDGATRLWAMRNDQELARLQSRSVRRVRAVEYAPEGKLLAAANGDGTVSLWDVATNREKTALAGHSGEVLCLTYRPDGGVLVTGGADGRVVFWDPASGTKLREWLLPAQVSGVAFAPDGRHLATALSNGAVYFFRVPQP